MHDRKKDVSLKKTKKKEKLCGDRNLLPYLVMQSVFFTAVPLRPSSLYLAKFAHYYSLSLSPSDFPPQDSLSTGLHSPVLEENYINSICINILFPGKILEERHLSYIFKHMRIGPRVAFREPCFAILSQTESPFL